jgi:aspartate carbamoyltransferase catalytic subunit
MSLQPIEAGPVQFNGDFRTDFLSASQLGLEDINAIHEEADAMRWMAEEHGVSDLLRGHIYDLVFWQSESTRTKGSFEHAIKRLGGEYILFDESTSSQAKGETFEDTIRMLDSYLVPKRDGFIIRHKDPGGVALAADIARSPVTNAGENHPQPFS